MKTLPLRANVDDGGGAWSLGIKIDKQIKQEIKHDFY